MTRCRTTLNDKRYYESMRNLLKLMPLCDEVLIYDNTQNYELIAKIINGVMDLQKKLIGLII